jgi:hypothetical protein
VTCSTTCDSPARDHWQQSAQQQPAAATQQRAGRTGVRQQQQAAAWMPAGGPQCVMRCGVALCGQCVAGCSVVWCGVVHGNRQLVLFSCAVALCSGHCWWHVVDTLGCAMPCLGLLK